MDTKLLEALVAAHGVSGDEEDIRALIRLSCMCQADDLCTDAMGNLIVHRKGSGKKVMLAAHMDTIGCIVTHIEKNGFMRFVSAGGMDPATVLQSPVRFRCGVTGLISANDNKLGKELKLSDLFIDIGAKDAGEVKKLISLGDTAAFATPMLKYDTKVISPYMDNRASCAALIEVLSSLKERKNDLYFVFTTQEELGMRGVSAACFAIEPDVAVAVDVTCPDDIPGALHESTTALRKGTAIKVMDHSVICSRQVIDKLKSLSEENHIPYQMDLMSCGGTDAGPMHLSRGGVLTGGVSIPCRYTHAPTELIDSTDYDASVKLLTAFCESEL